MGISLYFVHVSAWDQAATGSEHAHSRRCEKGKSGALGGIGRTSSFLTAATAFFFRLVAAAFFIFATAVLKSKGEEEASLGRSITTTTALRLRRVGAEGGGVCWA